MPDGLSAALPAAAIDTRRRTATSRRNILSLPKFLLALTYARRQSGRKLTIFHVALDGSPVRARSVGAAEIPGKPAFRRWAGAARGDKGVGIAIPIAAR